VTTSQNRGDSKAIKGLPAPSSPTPLASTHQKASPRSSLVSFDTHTTMANAMLEEDFRTSHPDLVTLDHQQQQDHQQQVQEIYADNNFDGDDDEIMDRKPKAATMTSNNNNNPPSRTKSVDFAILPPPTKRTRVAASSTWTAKQVVDGR